MLERLVAWFCNNYLGRYLENLNTDQLSVALLQGEVELENVPLRRDILDHLGLPIQVHIGYVGKVRFQIPVSKIRSEPWVISFEQLYLVAGPRDKNEPYNEEKEEARVQELKMATLDAMESEWRSERETQGVMSSSFYSLTYSSWISYGASLVTNIVQNLQFRVKDIHIRYEDDVSCPGSVFACGVRVESLTAQTCDENWTPKFMAATNSETTFKLVELDRLSVYWDTGTDMYSALPVAELSARMMTPCASDKHEFLLAPVSGHAHLKRNCSQKPLRSLNQPRLFCDFHLDRVTVELRDVQYHQLVQCCRSLEHLTKSVRYRRWRPRYPVTGNGRLWWQYVGQCVLSDIRKQWKGRNWDAVMQRVSDVRVYVRSYKEHLSNPAGVTATESKLLRDRIETELELEELQILRSIAMNQIERSAPACDPSADASASSQTYLNRWFSYWWPGDGGEEGGAAHDDRRTTDMEHEIMETLEDAMRNNTLSQRDTLPLQLSFTLKQGLLRLSSRQSTAASPGAVAAWSPILELECDNMVQEWESRPRLKSHRFHISLGNVLVRDCSTRETQFPLIVSPQRRDGRAPRPTTASLISSLNIPFFRLGGASPSSLSDSRPDESPLFDLVYEKRPPGSDWKHRLKVTSLAIECVYNRQLFQKVVELFSTPHSVMSPEHRSQLGQRLRQAARSGFEAVKQKTKDELSRSFVHRSLQHSWDLLVDISAPHILIPECVTSRESLLLVVDFGHFHVARSSDAPSAVADFPCSPPPDGVDDDDAPDDDEYRTPCSTPPNEPATLDDDGLETCSTVSGTVKEAGDPSDRYNVHFTDLQVLICRVKDSWKQAHLKGTSALHLLDRFSILIHVEKCGRLPANPDKPNLTLNGSLPHLVAHINEPKVHALVSISKHFQTPAAPTSDRGTAAEEEEDSPVSTVSSLADYQWVHMQFNVEQLSVEVQSRGRSVAELQVAGVQASYSIRPTDNSIRLAVHSLLLVDAMQTLGSDYELLIASHKHVSVDSMSGSLRESEPTSPVSPSSPDPSSKVHRATSPVSLAQALMSSLQTDPSAWRRDAASPVNAGTGVSPRVAAAAAAAVAVEGTPLKHEALILIDITTIGPTWVDGEADGKVQVVNVNFNSLDVIANQDTVVELVSFFQRIIPAKSKSQPTSPEEARSPVEMRAEGDESPESLKERSQRNRALQVPDGSIEITFDFHRLTILLLRSTVKDDTLVGRKVATLTVTDAKINASLASDVIVQGSLGGLQVLDLTPEGHKHQRVISVGHDPLVEQHQNLYLLVSQGLYGSYKEKNEIKAFSFQFLQPGPLQLNSGALADAPLDSSLENLSEERSKLSLEIRMASLCYTHSAHFLAEVAACVSEFQQAVVNLAVSLKLTAAEMAVDLMTRGTEGLAQSIYVSSHLSASFNDSLSLGASSRRLYDAADGAAGAAGAADSPVPEAQSLPSRVRFSALLESPILVLPRTAKSAEVLVAHLGQIQVSNDVRRQSTCEPLSEELAGGVRQEHFDIEVRDCALYSLNVDDKWRTSFSHFYGGPSAFLRVTAQELYGCASHGRPILHDTLLKFSLQRITARPVLNDTDPPFFPLDDLHSQTEFCDLVKVTGCVVSPLQMSLSRSQYKQIVDSLDNLNWVRVEAKMHEPVSVNTWEAELHAHPHKPLKGSGLLQPSAVAPMTKGREVAVNFQFQLPRFSMELLDSADKAIVSLSFEDLIVSYDKNSAHLATVQTSLKSLLLEDLMVSEDSKYRHLVTSNTRQSPDRVAEEPRLRPFLSTSCPDLRNADCIAAGFRSLPGRLEPLAKPWVSARRAGESGAGPKSKASGERQYPQTPPSSPLYHDRFQRLTNDDNLVYIKVLLVDPQSADFTGRYNSTQRFVEVDFNSLDVVVNLESWVMVLDFFGTGGADRCKSRAEARAVQRPSSGYQDWKVGASGREVNSLWEVEVRSFNVLLNQKDYEVASATISNLTWEMASRRGNLDITGKLGGVTVQDLTSAGRMYRERFVTSGTEALDFQFFCFSADDPQLARDYDVRLNVNMASVLYVHTHRFYMECLTLLQQFQQLRQVASRLHSTPAQQPQRDLWRHGTRILLNVEAGSPVILLPVCSTADHLLVVDLGKMSVSNHFVMSSDKSSTASAVAAPARSAAHHKHPEAKVVAAVDSAPVLIDVIQVELSNMDLCTGLRQKRDRTQPGDLLLGSYLIRRKGESLLKEMCGMKLEIRRNLDAHLCKPVPDVDVRGLLSTVECCIDEHQYKLVRGLLSFNLGEPLDFLRTAGQTAQVVDGSSPAGAPSADGSDAAWPSLKLRIDLFNVVLEVKDSALGPLATVKFIDSRLVFENFSDGSKDVDLVSQQVVVRDTRYDHCTDPAQKRNVFARILEPVTHDKREGALQAEVHFRSTRDFTRWTVVLNKQRLLAVFDWWALVQNFLLQSPDEYRGVPSARAGVYRRSDAAAEDESASGSPAPPHWSSSVAKPSPIVVSTGVISKRAAVLEGDSIPVEFKVNISDSEVVIVEDTSDKDSFAVILKGTAVVTYRPQILTKPLSCHFNQVEIFSSILSMEEDSALNVVDPVTISVEVVGKSTTSGVQGIPDATKAEVQQTLEIQAQQLILRLSYNDMKLFARILDSLPRQTRSAPTSLSIDADRAVEQLGALGFAAADCRKAFESCNGCVEEAAIWLTQNAVPTPKPVTNMKIGCLEVRMGTISLCVIDDCRDADVPLLEVTAAQLVLRQSVDEMRPAGEGQLSCQLSVEYYNRVLSGWEPFVEPFRCHLKWNSLPFAAADDSVNRRSIVLDTEDVVNVNFTRALVELYRTVKLNWTEDYFLESGGGAAPSLAFRRRSPFVPFALHNATGSRLKFRTQTASATQQVMDPAGSQSNGNMASAKFRWMSCEAGDVVTFSFENRGKLRHYDSHELQSHQLVIEIDGWMEFGPVSVDRVGSYFRFAAVQSSPVRHRSAAALERELDRILVVVAVSLEGSARRLVTIRSALLLTNNLEETVELRLEPPPFSLHPTKHVRVPPCTTYPVPLSHLLAQIFVRPLAEKHPHCYSFCNRPIEWQQGSHQDAVELKNESGRQCNPVTSTKDPPYRFAVNIHREHFTPERHADGTEWTAEPAHTITLVSPLIVVNLLPYELRWEIKAAKQFGIVKPGKESCIHTVDVMEDLQMAFHTENFTHSGELMLSAPPLNFTTRLRLYDSANRLLYLQAKISSKAPGSLKLSISAPYWLVNKAGIPLIFRQEGVQQEAAGQFEEHEMARSLTPMLFSLTDREASPTLTARIGNGLHPGCKSHWCQHFPLQKGVRVRSFLVSPRDGRPELVYLVGISIRPGRGRYRDTQIVSLAPCYQLYNQSSRRLEVAQGCFATTFTDPGAQSTYLNLLPGCHLPFHWPRLDKDQILCVRFLDVPGCHWSGGFAIRNISSFHINVRDADGRSMFIRVEIVQQECTFCVVFSDASGFPPPFRVDNLAELPIHFHQSDVPEAYLQTVVRPHSSVPYVWDEPTKAPHLTVIVPGGVSASYDMTSLKEGSQMTYENFIYVCLTATFATDGSLSTADALQCASRELVLDVPEGTRVVLSPKEAGQRTQLWRMTGSGMLQHEGSSPPRDPDNPHVDPPRVLVLDIAGPALQPSEFVHLMLRKPDPRRQLTQTWRFTEDGRLCCGHSNVYVQAKDGFRGIRQGNDVVLGPPHAVTYMRAPNGVPAEQAFHWQRLRPGSGILSVRVVMDGPTRVLQIADFVNKQSANRSSDSTPTVPDARRCKKAKDLHVEMRLKGGLGVSIVDHNPAEELAYCRLSNICLELVTGAGNLSIDASVQSIQIDNTLHDPQSLVVLYVTPAAQQDDGRHLPALHVTVNRLVSEQLNADIFKHLIVTSKNLTINIEEVQLFKLLAFAGFNQSDLELERMDESDFETQRSLNAATSVHAKRYYFGVLKLALDQVRLSVFTSSKLPTDLKPVKRKLGLTLIRFEDAYIELDPFIRQHPFETAQLLIDSIVQHYKDELKSQAAKILGSTDFLGNPLGFVNDVTEGLSGFVTEGNVGALVQNVTYGLSNSAAKVTGSLSEGLGRVTMDDKHEEVRQRILKHQGQSGDHLVAGLKGFGFGILGGMTSIFTQTFEGVSSEGLAGLFTGFGKGLVGTVTKPAVGVLDLANGAASAVRDSSRSSSKEVPKRLRPPRLVTGPGGILPRYSERQGRGQELLYQLNGQTFQETFIAYEALGSLPDSLHMLISSEQVRVFSVNSPTKDVVLDIHLSELHYSKTEIVKDYGTLGSAQYYVKFTLHGSNSVSSNVRQPQVRCESESLAKRVSQEVNYAKSVYDENRHTFSSGQPGFQAE